MVEGGNSKKVWERDTLWVNQPSEPKGPEEIGKEVGHWSKSEPNGIDGSQESIKISEGNLEKKNEDDSSGDENGENDAFWQGDSGASKGFTSETQRLDPVSISVDDYSKTW